MQTGGSAGYIEEVTWDNKLVWKFQFAPFEKHLSHHALEPLPNGNVLALCWERKTKEDALKAGRHPEFLPDNEIWNDLVVELEPDRGKKNAKVIWKWSAWDNLVQDYDPNKNNYGDIKSPDKLNINYCVVGGKAGNRNTLTRQKKDKSTGGVNNFGNTGNKNGNTGEKDWLHVNHLCYDAEYDQVLLSVNCFNEVWIIDRTSGNIIYRWGNPEAYGRGTMDDQKLFCQHSAIFHKNEVGERGFIVYNNGRHPDRAWSTVDEIRLPEFLLNMYKMDGETYGPETCEWRYGPSKGRANSWYDTHTGHCQRLRNGNTLITMGTCSTIVEVTKDKEEVWRYYSPVWIEDDIGYVASVRQGYQRPIDKKFSLFHSKKYSIDYPAFDSKDLKAYRYIEA